MENSAKNVIDATDAPVKNVVAKNLIELRKSRKLTQSDLAEMLNYSDKTISKWENGDSLPDIAVLAALTDIYGITLDDLVHANAAERSGGNAKEKREREKLRFCEN